MQHAQNLVHFLGHGVSSVLVTGNGCPRQIQVQFTNPIGGAMAAFALNAAPDHHYGDFQTWRAEYAGFPVLLYGAPLVEYHVEWPGDGGCRIVLANGAVLGAAAIANAVARALGFRIREDEAVAR